MIRENETTNFKPFFVIIEMSYEMQLLQFTFFLQLKKHKVVSGTQPRNFRAGEASWSKGTSIKISSTTHKRKAAQGKISVFFSPRYFLYPVYTPAFRMSFIERPTLFTLLLDTLLA